MVLTPAAAAARYNRAARPPDPEDVQAVEPYDGDGDAQAWLSSLEHWSELCCWSAHTCMQVARIRLKGAAQQWVQHAKPQDWASFSSAFLDRFAASPTAAIDELYQCTQKVTESPDEYATRFMRLSSITQWAEDATLLHMFIAGLQPDLQVEVRRKELSSIDAVVTFCRHRLATGSGSTLAWHEGPSKHRATVATRLLYAEDVYDGYEHDHGMPWFTDAAVESDDIYSEYDDVDGAMHWGGDADSDCEDEDMTQLYWVGSPFDDGFWLCEGFEPAGAGQFGNIAMPMTNNHTSAPAAGDAFLSSSANCQDTDIQHLTAWLNRLECMAMKHLEALEEEKQLLMQALSEQRHPSTTSVDRAAIQDQEAGVYSKVISEYAACSPPQGQHHDRPEQFGMLQDAPCAQPQTQNLQGAASYGLQHPIFGPENHTPAQNSELHGDIQGAGPSVTGRHQEPPTQLAQATVATSADPAALTSNAEPAATPDNLWLPPILQMLRSLPVTPAWLVFLPDWLLDVVPVSTEAFDFFVQVMSHSPALLDFMKDSSWCILKDILLGHQRWSAWARNSLMRGGTESISEVGDQDSNSSLANSWAAALGNTTDDQQPSQDLMYLQVQATHQLVANPTRQSAGQTGSTPYLAAAVSETNGMLQVSHEAQLPIRPRVPPTAYAFTDGKPLGQPTTGPTLYLRQSGPSTCQCVPYRVWDPGIHPKCNKPASHSGWFLAGPGLCRSICGQQPLLLVVHI